MKFGREPGLRHASLLFAVLLAMPAWAQQEVSPDHFDDHPAASEGRNPSSPSHKAAATQVQHTAVPASAQAKPKSVQTAVLKADAGKRTAQAESSVSSGEAKQ
jgi:hypothetical protein